MMWIVLGVVAGLVIPVQTVVNTRLRQSTGTPFSSSMISFLVGTLTLSVATVIATVATAGGSGGIDFGATHGQPAWLWIGGLLGVIALTGNIFLFPRLGAVQTAIFPIAGQVLMGLAIDHFGLFDAPQAAFTPLRAVGGLLTLLGVMVAVGVALPGRGRQAASASGIGATTGARAQLPWQAAGVVFGCLTACQAAVNGRLGAVISSPVAAALVSFAVGATTLVILNIVLRWRPRVQVPAGHTSNPWWMWTGGCLGALFVFGNACLVPIIGTGPTVVATLLGSLAGSVAVDRYNGHGITTRRVLGLAMVLAGVVTIRLL